MAIKKLQNDFTTPEQSQRLLELGVPADSADFYMYNNGLNVRVYYGTSLSGFLKECKEKAGSDVYIPCWSVGRLLEIIIIVAGEDNVDFETLILAEGTLTEKFITLIENLVKYEGIDFSKLEE